MPTLLEHVEIQPEQEAVASVIWLHGLGADGHDFEPIVPELNLPDALPIRFIFPHAPIRPVSVNEGDEMRAWYDFSFHSEKGDGHDIETSANYVRDFIDQEMARGNSKPQNYSGGVFSRWRRSASHRYSVRA